MIHSIVYYASPSILFILVCSYEEAISCIDWYISYFDALHVPGFGVCAFTDAFELGSETSPRKNHFEKFPTFHVNSGLGKEISDQVNISVVHLSSFC